MHLDITWSALYGSPSWAPQRRESADYKPLEEQVKSIQGDLGFMSLKDLFGWGEGRQKTGTLKIFTEEVTKAFYFQEGKVIFLTSNRDGERIGEFLAKVGCLELGLIKTAITQSQQQGVPFTRFLLSERLLEPETLETLLNRLVTIALADAMAWRSGQFEFTSSLPPAIVNGPIKLRPSILVKQANRMLEQLEAEKPDQKQDLVRQIAQRMAKGDIDIPPMPDMLIRINECIRQDEPSAHEIMKIIMADQILTTKILKVANSAYYGLPAPVTSLQHAIVYMGFQAMVNVVTAYALNKIMVKNTEGMKDVLRHSLMCGFLAKKIGNTVRFDEEEAFVCGLLHDMGKTALLTLLADVEIPDETKNELVEEYHAQAGSLLAIKWNFPDMVRNAVRFHHQPSEAPQDHEAAEIVWLANNILHQPDQTAKHLEQCQYIATQKIDLDDLLAELETIEEAAGAII